MISERYTITLVLCLGILIGCSSSDKPQQQQEAQKESAPQTDAEYIEQATFTDFQGNNVNLSDFKGKVVLIDFWETWCKPCIASFPTLQKLQENYSDSFVVLAVTPGFTDTREDARSFAEEHDYTFEYLMDSNNLHRQLGVQSIPYKIFVDPEGNFIKKSIGSRGADEDYKKVKQVIEKHKKS